MSFCLQVKLTDDQILEVQVGDHFGFTWLNHGVVKFCDTTPGQYCEDSVKLEEGSNVVLQPNRNGNRDYSIRVTIKYLAPFCGTNIQTVLQ